MARDVTDYERSFIGSLLFSPTRMAEAMAAGVQAQWFTSDAWSLMWSALESFWRRGEIESVSAINARAEAQRIAAEKKESRVADELTVAALQQAIDDAVPGPLEPTIRLLRNGDIERRAKRAVSDVFGRLESYADYTDAACDLRNGIDEILGRFSATKKITPRAVFDGLLAEYDEAHRMRVAADGPRDLTWTPGIKMPWPKMTTVLNGLRSGLHVVAARPSVGKTSFAVNLMRYWCDNGVPVLFNSLDMPRAAALGRFVAERSRVSFRKALFSPTRQDLDDMRKAVDIMAGWPLSVVEIRDVDEFRTMCKIEQAAGRLGVVVVDYLGLMHARALGREDSVEYARVSYVSDTLKSIANELHVPVVALAQLNREVTKTDAGGRMPGLADLRGSGSIEQDAYTVTILHRDQYVCDKWANDANYSGVVRQLTPGAADNPGYSYGASDLDCIWWVLCKAQNGPTGKLPFLVRKKYFTWMLGDFEAEAAREQVGYGSTAKEIVNNSPKFARVHADWRHDPIETELSRQGVLLEEGALDG